MAPKALNVSKMFNVHPHLLCLIDGNKCELEFRGKKLFFILPVL